MDGELEQATCRECQVSFRVRSAWWRERGLHAPSRCPWCREARREQRGPAAARHTGVVDKLAEDFGFLVDSTGQRYFFSRFNRAMITARDAARLAPGTRVSFTPAPTPPAAGRAPRALDVRLEDGHDA
ncbi:MAG: hypothetical protein R2712_31825 [Vicinamibacterales bacterium]